MPQTLHSGTPTARKEHQCDWCGFKILKGETYEYSTVAYAGELYAWKNHITCRELSNRMNMWEDVWSEGLDGEAFSTYIREDFCDKNPNLKIKIPYKQAFDFAESRYMYGIAPVHCTDCNWVGLPSELESEEANESSNVVEDWCPKCKSSNLEEC